MKLLAFASALLLTGCTGGQVSTTANQNVNFAQYKTYAYLTPSVEVGKYPALSSDIIKQDLKAAIETQLSERGLRYAATNPDVLVGYHVYTKTKQQYISQTDPSPYTPLLYGGGYRRGWGYYPYGYNNWPYQLGGGTTTTTEQNYTDGTLVIDFVRPSDKTVVWRGADVSPLNPQNPQSVDAEAVKGVQEIFKKYPVAAVTGSR